jgi:hypothetical protein
MAEAAALKEPPLDELMLAMDVVDTLRHSEALVERELAGADRRAVLIARLKEIYRGQGIDVAEYILVEGVDALEQDRFVYRPPVDNWQVRLARLYIDRSVVGRRVGIAALVLAVLVGGWYGLVRWPQQRAAEEARIELAETIPQSLRQLSESIVAEADDPAVDQQAVAAAADGRGAAQAGDAERARAAITELTALLAELRVSFEVRVVSRPGELTGVTRIPDVNQTTENAYLIVEAIAPDGSAVARPIRSEEDQSVRTVSMWGVRVPDVVFERVQRDKLDDGIVQDSLVGAKQRGRLVIDWVMPVLDGMITEW